MLISGGGVLDTTKVELTVMAPSTSSALIWIDIPTTSPDGTSCSPGVPNSRLAVASKVSHGGDLTSVYDIVSEEGKVCGEKVKENGCDMRATGGSWELIGKDSTGAATATLLHNKSVDPTAHSATMVKSGNTGEKRDVGAGRAGVVTMEQNKQEAHHKFIF
jgi:hypothetical protein